MAALLDRTVHATEALLVRARAAFRRAYETTEVAAMTDPFTRLRDRSTPSIPTPPSPLNSAAG